MGRRAIAGPRVCGGYYNYDRLRGAIEIFDRFGRHKGAKDPLTLPVSPDLCPTAFPSALQHVERAIADAAKRGGLVAQELSVRKLGTPVAWVPAQHRDLLAGQFTHGVDVDSRDLVRRFVTGLATLETESSDEGSVSALLIEDPIGAEAELASPSAVFSATVDAAMFHVVDELRPGAISDALDCLALPFGMIGVLSRVSRPERFRGRRTRAELTEVCASASLVFCPAWDAQGFLLAPLIS